MTDSASGNFLSKLQQTKLPLWVSLALLIAVLAVYGWQQAAVSKAESRLEAERAQMTQQLDAARAALIGQANEFAARQGDTQSRRFGQALSWALRGELLRNNLEQVDQFSNELVKVSGIDLVVFADAQGKILIASNKKHQGSDFAQAFPAELLQVPEVTLRAEGPSGQLLIVPVMGLNSRLGTLVLRQQPARFSPQ